MQGSAFRSRSWRGTGCRVFDEEEGDRVKSLNRAAASGVVSEWYSRIRALKNVTISKPTKLIKRTFNACDTRTISPFLSTLSTLFTLSNLIESYLHFSAPIHLVYSPNPRYPPCLLDTVLTTIPLPFILHSACAMAL